jgi:biotin carboxylase
MSRPRILLVLSSHTFRAGAFLDACRRLGVAVTVATDGPLAPLDLDPGAALAIDLAHPEKAAAQSIRFSASYPIAAAIAAEDEGAPAAAAIGEALQLRGHPLAAVQTARDKHAARTKVWEAGLATPPFALFSTADDPETIAGRLPYPCVLKPTTLSASQGVIRADDEASFVAAWLRLRAILKRPGLFPPGDPASDRILVEGYLPGDEVAVEGLVTEGRFRTLAIFDKPDPLVGPHFEETIYVTPSRLSARRRRAAVAAAQDAAAVLGLRDGPLHAEVRVQGEAATLVEIAPRSIGGLCSRALRFRGGRSLEDLLLLHALGRPTAELARERRASGVMMIPIPGAGILRSVKGVDRVEGIPGIEEVRLTIPPGSYVEPAPEGHQYLGFVFARGRRPQEVEWALRRARRALRVHLTAANRRQVVRTSRTG